MPHFDEKTVELIVLDSESVRHIRADFFRHIDTCQSCRMLYADISEFYQRLSGPQRLPEQTTPSGRSLQIRPQFGLPAARHIVGDRPAVVRFIANHRASVVSAGSITIVAVLAFLFTLRSSPSAKNAHHVEFEDALHEAVIYSEHGDMLFKIPIPAGYTVSTWRFVDSTPSTVVTDMDGDGRMEIVTMIPVIDDDRAVRNVLRVFRSDGSVAWERSLGEALTYKGEVFSENFQLKGMAIRDFDGDGRKEVIIGAAHYHSPCILYRLDADGNEIGQYRTFGHVSHIYPTDLEFDGSTEIIVCGQLDTRDFGRRAIIAALNPKEIVGKSEATFAPGFGLPPSAAERFVLRLPWSHIDSALSNPKPRVTSIHHESPSEIRLVVGTEFESSAAQIEYALSRDFMPLQVQWTDGAREAHANLLSRRMVKGELSLLRAENLVKSVDFWDGARWTRDLKRPPKLGGASAKSMWNPVRAELRGTIVELFNESGRMVREVPVTASEAGDIKGTLEGISIKPSKVGLLDCDGDSFNELIMFRQKGNGSRIEASLVCLSVKDLVPLWEKRLHWDISFPRKSDDIPQEYAAGIVYFEDLDADGRKEIIVLTGNVNMFPTMIARLDPSTGRELNLYLHIGNLSRLSFADLDGDGRKEILGGGINNGYHEAVFVVLHGDLFFGVSPHTPEYAPIGWPAANEAAYIRFPRTIVGDTFWMTSSDNAFQSVDILAREKKLQVWLRDFAAPVSVNETQSGTIGISLSYDFRPLRVSTSSLFDAVARRLFKEGKLSRTVDAKYWKEYLSQIQRWNGASWYSAPVAMTQGIREKK